MNLPQYFKKNRTAHIIHLRVAYRYNKQDLQLLIPGVSFQRENENDKNESIFFLGLLSEQVTPCEQWETAAKFWCLWNFFQDQDVLEPFYNAEMYMHVTSKQVPLYSLGSFSSKARVKMLS